MTHLSPWHLLRQDALASLHHVLRWPGHRPRISTKTVRMIRFFYQIICLFTFSVYQQKFEITNWIMHTRGKFYARSVYTSGTQYVIIMKMPCIWSILYLREYLDAKPIVFRSCTPGVLQCFQYSNSNSVDDRTLERKQWLGLVTMFHRITSFGHRHTKWIDHYDVMLTHYILAVHVYFRNDSMIASIMCDVWY